MQAQIIYIADDGKEFNNLEECQKYEAVMKSNEMVIPHMWNLDGELITDPDAARLIYLGDIDCPLGGNFIQLCKDNNADYDGITSEDSGWFFWEEYDGHYIYVDDHTIDLFSKVFSKK